MIKLTVEGVVYEYDGDRLLLAEARELKLYTGFTPGKWGVAIDEGDPDALAFLIYLSKKRAGETLRYSDLDLVNYADIEMEFIAPVADAKADDGAVEGPPAVDPPEPSSTGTTPTPGTGNTSDPSPTTSNTPPPTSAP